MGRLYAGTSGWAYTSWRRGFYPKKLPAAEFLNYYATRLNSVEVNYSFLHPLTGEVVAEWIAATPPDFKLAVKAPQFITHMKRLRGVKRPLRKFLSFLEPIADANKLGPILFQLPPNFKCNPDLLQQFLAGLPPHPRAAFEFRHASWFTDEVFDLLRNSGAALCQAESEKLETPHIHTSDFAYLRLRKDRYSPASRRTLHDRVKEAMTRGDVFVYFKHAETPEGALHAEALLTSVTRPPETGIAPL
jgi:uncharacterized protein YecE (DUF72 family)